MYCHRGTECIRNALFIIIIIMVPVKIQFHETMATATPRLPQPAELQSLQKRPGDHSATGDRTRIQPSHVHQTLQRTLVTTIPETQAPRQWIGFYRTVRQNQQPGPVSSPMTTTIIIIIITTSSSSSPSSLSILSFFLNVLRC